MSQDASHCLITLKKLRGTETKPGYSTAGLKALFDTTKVEPCFKFLPTEIKRLANAPQGKRFSISGVQSKAGVELVDGYLELQGAGSHYILKPSPGDYPQLAENEFTSMHLANLCRIPTPMFGLFPFNNGELGYLIRRYDRKKETRFAQEDMMQILGIANRGDAKYGEGFDISYSRVGQHILAVTKTPAEVLQFYRRVVFCYLIGNNDLHLKNISLWQGESTTGGAYRLTPAYDLVNVDLYGEGEYVALDLTIGEEKGDFSEAYNVFGQPSRADFVLAGVEMGLPEKAVIRVIDNLTALVPKMTAQIEISPLCSDFKRAYVRTIENRTTWLQKTL